MGQREKRSGLTLSVHCPALSVQDAGIVRGEETECGEELGANVECRGGGSLAL